MTSEMIASLLQAGTGGIVIVVVIIFLNFMKDERASRLSDVIRFTEALEKRDIEFSKRNDAVIRAIETQTARSDAICRSLEGLTNSIIQHDTRTAPAVERIMESEPVSTRRRAIEHEATR